MAVDEELAARVRLQLAGTEALTERKMFGGIAFMVRGNMACGITSKGAVMVRCLPDQTDALLDLGAVQMHMGPRQMTGFLEAPAAVLSADDALGDWVQRGVDAASSLPPK